MPTLKEWRIRRHKDKFTLTKYCFEYVHFITFVFTCSDIIVTSTSEFFSFPEGYEFHRLYT